MKKRYKRTFLVLYAFCSLLAEGVSAQSLVLSLEKTISLAADSSLEAFRTKNLFLSGYWEFRNYKAERLPSLTLNITPAEYYRDITKRYDSEKTLTNTVSNSPLCGRKLKDQAELRYAGW